MNRLQKQKLYQSYKWRKFSKEFLKKNPLCSECLKKAKLKRSFITDHQKPFSNELEFFDNLFAPYCQSCHSKKTISEKNPYDFDKAKAHKTRAEYF